MNIFDPHISGSLSVSGSGEISGDLRVLGTISGSIKGDGSQLFNIPSSGVTGLNLTRIADGSATASISSANGLVINTNTEITGTLKLNKVNLGGNNIVNLTLTDGGGKFYINGVKSPRLSFIKGFKYRFNYNNNNTHPLLFSLTSDGEHNGGTTYTTGITTNADPFYIEVEVTDATAATLYYWCDHHVGMGNAISVYPDFLHGQSSINLINVDTEMYATTGSNNFTNIQRTSGSLVVTGSVDVTGSINLFGTANISGSILLNGQAIGTGKLDETTFNSYTSSNDSRVSSLESSTGSLNTFTSSIDTTIKNKLNTETVISGSVQVLITGTTGYSTFSSSISTSIGSLSSSVVTTTSGLSSSIGSLSSTIDSLSSSVATTTSGLSSSVATTTSGLSSSIATTTLGLSSSIVSLSSSVATTTSGLSSSIVSLSSSVATTTLNTKNRVDSIETSTGSLNSFTSSINTTIKSKLDSESVISGSVQVVITGTTGYSAFSSSVATTTSGLSSSIGSLSSSVATTTSGLSSSVAITTSGLTSTITSLSSSVATTTSGLSSSIGSLSSSVATTTSGLSSSIVSLSSSVATTTSGLSSSVATTTSGLSSSIGSLSSSVATTTSGLSSSIVSLSSSVATTTLGTKNRVDSIEAKTGSYATTGSNIFQGNQTITGSLYVSQDLIIAGSSSIQHISSSIVNIADNIITVNASNPSLRFGGLAVIDSGSSPQVSGSILFDSVNNQWLFVHQNQATVTSSMLIMGPETYDNVGNETHLTLNRLVKSVNDEHIGDSNITDTGTKVSINSNTEVTGTLKVTGNITNPNITAIESATGSLNTFTSSLLTAIELTGSNLTVRGNFLVKGTTTNVNTTTLDVDNNLINLNGSGASFAGLRVKDTTAPNQISGSLLWDAANDYWIAGQLGSEQRLVRETEFNNAVTRIGNVETSTGSLNSFTSSINTTIKTKLNTEGVLSSSIQVNHNATTNYVANQHIDHTTVSITAGSGLTGGGDISTTRTINVGAGNGITVNADDIAIDTSSATFTTGVKTKMNTDTVMSGSYLGTATTANLSENASYLYYTDARVKTKLNAEGVVSGSSQITFLGLSSIPSGLVSGSSQVLNGTTIHSGSFFNGISVVSGSAQIDGSLLGSNKTITIGSTSTTLGGTSTSLAGLTSVTSTAFTGSLQGLATSETLSTVTGRGNTTTDRINVRGIGNQSGGNILMGNIGVNTNKWSYLTGTHYNTSTQPQGVSIIGLYSDLNNNSVIIGGSIYEANPATEIQFWTHNATSHATGGTLKMTLNSAGNLIITGTVSASNFSGTSSGTNTGDETLARVNALAITTVGTITSGTWNGSAIGNAYLANSSFNIGTTSISLGRATGAQTLAGVSIDGAAGSSPALTANGALTTQHGDGVVGYVYAISSATTGLFTAVDNSNSILTINRHPGNYYSQLGFSSNGNIYYRSFSAAAINTSTAWKTIIDSGNIGSQTVTNITASSNTSLTSLANLATVGTIGTGVWNGSSIGTAYTAAKVTAVNAGTGVGVDTTTGSVTVSIGQAVGTSSNVTFGSMTGAITSSGNGDGNAPFRFAADYSGWMSIVAGSASGANGWGLFWAGNDGSLYGTNQAGAAGNIWSNSTNPNEYVFVGNGVSVFSVFGNSGHWWSKGNGTVAGTLTVGGSTAKTVANSSYSTTFSSVSSVTVTHSLGTKDVAVFVYDSSDNMFWPSSIVTTSTSVVTITFSSSRSGRVVVVR